MTTKLTRWEGWVWTCKRKNCVRAYEEGVEKYQTINFYRATPEAEHCIACEYYKMCLSCSTVKDREDDFYPKKKNCKSCVLGKKKNNSTVKEYKYSCDKCSYFTDNRKYYLKHIKTSKHKDKHKEDKEDKKDLSKYKYICDLCNYGTDLKQNLNRHFKGKKHLAKI